MDPETTIKVKKVIKIEDTSEYVYFIMKSKIVTSSEEIK